MFGQVIILVSRLVTFVDLWNKVLLNDLVKFFASCGYEFCLNFVFHYLFCFVLFVWFCLSVVVSKRDVKSVHLESRIANRKGTLPLILKLSSRK